MRWIAGLVFLLQAAALPPAYPRPGTTKLLENDRVQVWDISWLKQTYPLHRHRYDLIGVYYTDGDRMIVSQQGERRPVSTKAWETAFQAKDVTHIEEGASDAPLRAVFVEMKEPAATGAVDAATTPAAFPAGTGKQLRDNERATLWEFVPAPAKGAPHRHQRDAVVIAGQAASHCVKSTIDDLLSEIAAQDANLAKKVYLVTDCMSAVTVPDGKGGLAADFTAQADAALQKFADAGMHLVKSTDPITSWF